MCFRLFFGNNVKTGWYGLFRDDDQDLEPQQYEFTKNSKISKILLQFGDHDNLRSIEFLDENGISLVSTKKWEELKKKQSIEISKNQ